MQSVISLHPSPAYSAISRAPSVHASIATRKLLILDLNGTLLLRPKSHRAHRRPIHPRPYMPVFRHFLFHQAVKAWLEVRVWSSAQPHNVDSMVEQSFADQRHELQAVWARDTLDLTTADYSHKVQTTKNLEKHWAAQLSGFEHSARTTLLLDDSPLKAQLQPYNHLCVSEYTQKLRNHDLSAKKENNPGQGFDQTLIAVIGVLDEVQHQTNVAGWIRAGGLWAGREPASVDAFLKELGDSYLERRKPQAEPQTGSLLPGNDAQDPECEEDALLMWFDHQSCFQYWVDRGIRAVEALGIKLQHGIDR